MQRSISFPRNRSKIKFELVHMDMWGLYKGEFITNTSYMLTFVEDHSRCTWIFLLSAKEQVAGLIYEFLKMVETQFAAKVKKIKTDNGSEFLNKEVHDILVDAGVIHLTTCTYSPQQNGVVEKKHRTLLQTTRALMFHSKVPHKLWPYSLMHATWLLNRLRMVNLEWKSPYMMLFREKVDPKDFIPFGCLAYAADTWE